MKSIKKDTPLYMLDAFSSKAKDSSFYIERFAHHLEKHKFVNKPHSHDFYLLMYVTKGSGDHTIDFVTHAVLPGSFFVMTPGQVHSWNLMEGIDGYIIFFHPAFYKMQMQERNLLAFPFFHALNANPCILLDAHQQTVIDFVADQMHAEFTSSPEIDLRLLRNYLEILLLKLSANFQIEQQADFTNSVSFKIRKLEQLVETIM